jgi:hypothetical protein
MVNNLNMTFRKLLLLSVFTVLFGVGLVYALSYGFKPQNSSQTLRTAKGVSERFGLELTLTLEKTEYALGEPINVTLTITNISNQTISFLAAPAWWDFLVFNDTDNCIYKWRSHSGQAVPMLVRNVPLDPGMSLTNQVYVWPQTCNKTLAQYGIPNSSVSPGTYYIVGRYCYNPFGSDSNYNLETTPIQVTITQP